MSENNKATALPTKQFFVSMLTRDIGLADAILDLIDNCLDGALRSSSGSSVDYTKYTIKITANTENFIIEDNCGGIPRDIAQKYAFRMGRERGDDRDSENETIGMYGIGMKRAIFKMGENAIVSTRHGEDSYCVRITPDWLNDSEWKDFDLESLDTDLAETGTRIEITSLYSGISLQFGNEAFINDLMAAVGEHFTSFIQRGIHIYINETLVQPVLIRILMSSKKDGPAPFVYCKRINSVNVTITVGLNTVSSLDDDEYEYSGEKSAVAGWTVFCNDRAIIVGDKSRITGWGDGLPLYHGQFSVITGIVEFRSENAEELPITTTKRALDTSSEIWLEARAKMRDGLRVWIDYTNKWKNHPREDQSPHWKESRALSLSDIAEEVSSEALPMTRKNDGATEFDPAKHKRLPLPENEKPSSQRIVFSRPKSEIVKLSSFFFDRNDVKPSIVGEECFKHVLEKMED